MRNHYLYLRADGGRGNRRNRSVIDSRRQLSNRISGCRCDENYVCVAFAFSPERNVFEFARQMCDYGVSRGPFEKIRPDHLLCGWRGDGVNVCSVAHEFASYLGCLERGYTTCHEESDFLSSQFSPFGGDDVFRGMTQGKGRPATSSTAQSRKLRPIAGLSH